MRKLTIVASSLALLLMMSGVALSAPCTSPGSIVSVILSSSGQFEYVTFKMKKPLNSNYGSSVTTAFPVFKEEPSDNPVTVVGPKYKKITFTGISWTCSIAENLSVPKMTVKDIKRLEQDEGIVVYVVGYKQTATKYYVSTTVSNTGSNRFVKMKFRRY